MIAWLGAAGLALLALASAAGLLDLSCPAWIRLLAFGSALGGALTVGCAWGLRRAPRLPLLAVLATALAARLLLLPAPHSLSEDAARYHWDGKVLAHGINPYLYAPQAPELAHLPADALDERIEGRSRRTLTVYPPLAEVAFAAGYLLTPGRLAGLQLIWLAAEMLAWILLARELSRRRLPPARLLLGVWSPLVLVHGYLPGHVDLLILPFLVLFLGAVDREQPYRAGLWMALVCLVKPFPAILLPAAWASLGTRRTARLAAAMAATAALFYLPFADAGWRLFSSTLLMAREWSFNGSVAALLELALGRERAHLVAGALLVVLILIGARRGEDFLARCLWAALAFAACSPFLFPWYLLWIFPLIVLRPSPALIALGCLIPLSDLVMIRWLEAGIWTQPLWTKLLEYGAFYALLIRASRRRSPPSPEAP